MLKNSQRYMQLGRLWYWSNRRYSSQPSSSNEDYYQTLGVNQNASMEQIKASYRELSKKYHPDVCKDADAADKFKRISHAYTVLKDQQSRTKYDQDHSGYDYKGHTTQKYTYQAKNKKSGEEGERAEARARERQTEGETTKSEEQALYETIFGQTFKEDPMYFYKPENEHLRKRYEEELNNLRAKKAAEAGSGEQAGYKESFEDDPDWIKFMNDFRRTRAGEPGGSNVGYSAEAQPVNPSNLKLIGAGLLTFGGLVLYLLWDQRRKSTTKFENAAEKPLSNMDLESMRERHLKREEEKKEKMKVDFINSLALMKRYPKKNPNAISMLSDYTIWNDIVMFSVPWTYFHGDDEELTKTSTKFERNRLFNLKINTMLTLALEAERVFKNIFVKVDDVMTGLKETGWYEPPGAFFKFFGYIYVKIRRKPIIAENLLAAIQNGDKQISLFDLYFRYSTPILIANDEYYEIPLKHQAYVKDTTTREGIAWIGNAHVNHRPIDKKVVQPGERNVFMWKGPKQVTQSHERYLKTWGVYYDPYTKL